MTGEGEVRLLLSAGRGPRECGWAVAELLRRLEADAGRSGVAVRRVGTVRGDDPGTYRSVLLDLAGRGADAFAATWSGTLCWQAPSPYRSDTARKNWFVVARRLQQPVPGAAFDERDVDVVACRTGGPGGQHRNKVSTAARATHRPTGLVVVADTERQFGANRRLALERLRSRIEQDRTAVEREAAADRRATHDQLVRGNPTRVERPGGGGPSGSQG